MRNILLKSLYKIHKQGDMPAPSRAMTSEKSFACYQEMQKLSVESFKSHMAGNWSLVELGGSFGNLQQAFKYTLHKTKQIHQDNYPCNILYADPDVLCLEPIDPWGDHKNLDFHVFGAGNCGVRYFKNSMTNKLWKHAISVSRKWDNHNYNFEQDLYISLEKQAIKQLSGTLEDAVSACELWNQVDQVPNIDATHQDCSSQEIHDMVEQLEYHYDVPVVHFHSSRIPCATLLLMKKVWKHHQRTQQ
jgi:hypothetical protein